MLLPLAQPCAVIIITAGENSHQGLKIVGNFISQDSITNTRKWSVPDKPSLFMVFDQNQ